MPVDLFANAANTTLTASMLAGATSLTVTSSTPFPAVTTAAATQFRVIIDAELFIVTNVTGLAWTVTPGAEGTTQAAHANGATVTAIMTAGALTAKTGSPVLAGKHTGLWYAMTAATLSASSPAVGLANATPIVLPACTLQAISVRNLSAVASSFARLGIYSDDGTGYPGTLLIDAGPVSGATAGMVVATISQAVAGGMYWLVCVNQTGLPGWQNNTGILPFAIGSTTSIDAVAETLYVGYTMAGVTAALPATWSATVTPAINLTRLAVQVA